MMYILRIDVKEKCCEYEELKTKFDVLKSENEELKQKNGSNSAGLESFSRQVSDLENQKTQLSAKIKELVKILN